ncbi:MAG TPA: DUF5668 domain-containing protein, partial [Candidatus Limnocylindrales bacterium]|nr:DUF5668 domain-containing protein [Candidatus Limnocylindrales bacterium]
MADHRPRFSVQLVIGCAVAVLGVLFTLDNLNIVESEPILRWWPAVLVLVGLTKLLGLGTRPQMVAGALITGAGVLLLLASLDMLRFSIWELWPLQLVFLGAWLVLRGVRRTREGGPTVDPDDYANAFVAMGSVVRKMNSAQFRGGEVTAFMGG